MMPLQLNEKLRALNNAAVTSVTAETDSVWIEFGNRGSIYAGYWRLIVDGRAKISSFDHGQKYGLRNPVDAVEILRRAVTDRQIKECTVKDETGDLRLVLQENIILEVFNFTAAEAWEIVFADGTSQLSNYFKPSEHA